MKVKLIDITENPIEKIYKAYRICYSKDNWEDIKIPQKSNPRYTDGRNGEKYTITDLDKMINFIVPLMEEQHTSPLEHVSFSFAIEGISRACLSQLTRHRTFKFNVQSQRYVDGKNFDFVIPDLDYISHFSSRIQSRDMIEDLFEDVKTIYEKLITFGVKKEDARAILPQATTCNLVVTMDLNNFRNFLRQRLCVHAQKEIRELSQEMVKLLKPYIPFVDHKVLLCQRGLCNHCKVDK